MVTAASNANVALLLIDAKKGLLEQTFRHKRICDLMEIKNVILVVNKMDQVDFSQKIFTDIKSQYQNSGLANSNSKEIFIPISALKGDNVFTREQ